MTEPLYVPEEDLTDVIRVLRAGVKRVKVRRHVRTALLRWCREEEEYVRRLQDES